MTSLMLLEDSLEDQRAEVGGSLRRYLKGEAVSVARTELSSQLFSRSFS